VLSARPEKNLLWALFAYFANGRRLSAKRPFSPRRETGPFRETEKKF
jgi:hypothetical protein